MRILSTIFLVAILTIVGCSTTNPNYSLERNKELVRQVNDEVWNKGNPDEIDELFSTGFIRHFLPDGSELRGLENFREHVKKHREAFPGWREEIKHLVAEGDLVVNHFVSTGTNEGSWLGNPPTGKKIQINEMSIVRQNHREVLCSFFA